MPDLHLAVRPLQNISGQEEDESGASLNALKHALLCQIAGAVVVPDGATIKLIASRICVSIFLTLTKHGSRASRVRGIWRLSDLAQILGNG